jgi:hypothetical protein
MASYAKTDLLILDDWGLAPFTAAQRRHMLELLDDRYPVRPTLAAVAQFDARPATGKPRHPLRRNAGASAERT